LVSSGTAVALLEDVAELDIVLELDELAEDVLELLPELDDVEVAVMVSSASGTAT
jgi:hypothetical protein